MTTVDLWTAGLALVAGIALSMLWYERTGLSPGGVLAPGIAALLLVHAPAAAVLFSSLTVPAGLAIARVGERVYLFGRRRYAMLLLVGMALAVAADIPLALTDGLDPGVRLLAYLVPGLAAVDIGRQGVGRTMGSFAAVTAATAAVTVLGGIPC